MDMEMSQVERYGETIGAFESAYEELSKRLQETGLTFFNRARELEGAFTQKLEAHTPLATSLQRDYRATPLPPRASASQTPLA